MPIDELLASPRAMVRRWRAAEVASRPRGRGVTIRELVPEPVPDESMELMEFEAGAMMGGVPHSYQNADALRPARGVSVVELAKADVSALETSNPNLHKETAMRTMHLLRNGLAAVIGSLVLGFAPGCR
ncbi:MAG TPA: hypothetical protein VF319_14885 [Caldimonas sp.]